MWCDLQAQLAGLRPNVAALVTIDNNSMVHTVYLEVEVQ